MNRNKNTMRTKSQTKILYSSFFIYMYFIAEAINWFVILFIFRKNKTNENNWIDITVTKPSFYEPFSSGLVAVSIFHRLFLLANVFIHTSSDDYSLIENKRKLQILTFIPNYWLRDFQLRGQSMQTHINRDLIWKERHRINKQLIFYTELFHFIFRTI